MILVDIQIPALDRTYDFELDEETPAGELLKQIVQLVEEKVKAVKKEKEDLHLYAFYKGRMLDAELTLKEQGVETGEKLLLL